MRIIKEYSENQFICESAGLLILELSKNMNKAFEGDPIKPIHIFAHLRNYC